MHPVPPKIRAKNSRLAIVLLAVAGASLAGVVFFFDPATHAFYPGCEFHRLTGWNCPGCGMTRSLHALLHGNFSTAWRDNALLVGGLAALAARGAWFGAQQRRGAAAAFFPPYFLWPMLVITVGFTVLRNLPAGAFLSP